MGTTLNWKQVTAQQGGADIMVQLVGNADTEIATRYFWMPDAQGQVVNQWNRKDGEPLTMALPVLAGKLNRLGFVLNAAPLLPGATALAVSMRVMQGNKALLNFLIELNLSGSGKFVQYADGIQLGVA